MNNVELKAELRDLPLARLIAKAVGATFILSFDQTDTYYRVPSGKLKKRETTGEPVEYIFYERPHKPTAKLSQFVIYSEEQALERFGREPLPVWVVVKKTRELYMHANARIHLDTVEGLGTFLEFEALVSRVHDIEACTRQVQTLREKFAPVLGELIACGYSDLLARDQDNTQSVRNEPRTQ
ncbi:MAG TPA: class IV adenylate cyclase [Phycisphaerales bacterium]|nr:class IV adenylate cyclase [Phycisphaerales bacterium]